MSEYMSPYYKSLEEVAKTPYKTDSTFYSEKRGPGRFYYCPPDMYIKYWDVNSQVEAIIAQLKSFVKIESCVRLITDGSLSVPTTTIITVPFDGENDRIYNNLGKMIYDQLWAYYLAADPKTTHHGMTNLVFEGNETSLIRRELERYMHLLTYRTDLAGRAMLGYTMKCEVPALNRDTYMRPTVQDLLRVELGVRVYTHGEGVHRMDLFMPYGNKTAEAIDRIYYNIEHIIHQNLVAYDELHDHYLPVSTELVVRELEGVLIRARQKSNTRKKIVNSLKFHTVLLQDPSLIYHISLADMYYDKLNRIDLWEEASQRSRELFSTALIRSAELTKDAGVNVDTINMEERVYIERPKAQGQPATAAPRQAQTVAAGAPARPAPAARPAAKVPSKASDGLTEL